MAGLNHDNDPEYPDHLNSGVEYDAEDDGLSDGADGANDNDDESGGEEVREVGRHDIHESDEERMRREERQKAEKLAKERDLLLGDVETEIRQAAKKERQLDETEFLAKYGEVLDHIMQESASKKNVLHMLAIHPFEASDQFPRWIIDHIHRSAINDTRSRTRNSLSELLVDKAHTTPSLALATAIRWKNEPFIRTILSIEMQNGDESLKDSIRRNLRERVDAGNETPRNCIHWAIESLRPRLTVRLIEKAAGDECLLASDGKGYTPLHLAVEYPKCLERLEVIKALLKYGEKALAQRCKERLSVYRYYQKTMADHRKEESRKTSEAYKTNASLGRTERELKQVQNKQEAPTIGKQDRREKPKPNNVEPPVYGVVGRISRGKMPNDFTADVVFRNPTGDGKMIKPVQQAFDGFAKASNSYKAPLAASKRIPAPRKTVNGKKSTAPSKTLMEEEKEKQVEDEIGDELKLQYFRSTFKLPKPDWDVKSANGFLYPQGKERPFSLTMLEGHPSISQHVLTHVYGNEEYDHVLHHVAVRRVVLKQTKNKEAGRTDMEVIFRLLKDKGVRHIVKVIVFDSEVPPHSDESIERCLLGFKSIEILDWRKVDMCPETIYKACRDVVELHLRWSGNNAILVAWSAPGGLAKLPRLKKIHLHQTQCIESPDRDKKNLQRFKERLQKDRIAQRPGPYRPEERKMASSRLPVTVLDMWPDITVNDLDTSNPAHDSRFPVTHGPQLNQRAAQHRRRHEWLDIMDKFAAGIDLIEMEHTHQPDIFAEDVKVALIDDGVEITNRDLTDRIYNGWTCDTGYQGNGLEGILRPYTNSETQHGTFMASTICRICPRAKIFVFRLDVVSTPGDRAHFTAKSAADALELAIDPSRKFDVISMSWTIAKNQTNAKDIDRLDNALKQATAQNRMLLFCASPDNGEMTKAQAETFYPFGCDCGIGLFKMAAATADGLRISMAGSRFDYSLPGHEVESRNQGAGDGAKERLQNNRQSFEVEHSGLKTGSSIATALGAGLAALIIYCVRLSAAYMHRVKPSAGTSASRDAHSVVLTPKDVESIKQPKQMRDVFNSMMSKSSSSDRYIEVYDLFGGLANELEKLGQEIEELKDKIKNEIQKGTADEKAAEKELREKKDERMGKIVKMALRFVEA
ncbi:hypothetical protein A9Z42_0020150 [Trichoderma parareesei]|uniref:Peptidase S8/S53 domain-containing protein n=1 Tax=Trichoderma parareesei TaxID=858221 RepID=A0A2H2ZLT7_TRIPA|nr:hypothetical protein A9Z42_0020150 [Trichoderma parareesei]